MELSSPGERLRQLIENYANKWSVIRVEELQESIEAVTPDNRYSILSSQFDRGMTKWEKTILHEAVIRRDCQIISCVLDNVSADGRVELLKIQDVDGNTPLHEASLNDKSAFKVMVDRIPTEGRCVLFKITNKCNQNVFHMLEWFNRNAFHWLARDDDMVVDHLRDFPLDEKIDLLKTQDEEGKTPLHAAAERDNPLPFKHMLESLPTENRVDLLKIKDEGGRTPLHWWAIDILVVNIDDHVDSIEKMISDLLEWMSTDKLLDFLLLPDNEGRTFTHLVCRTFGIEFYWLPQYFTKGQIFTLFTVEDEQGRQPLYYAMKSAAEHDHLYYENATCCVMKTTSSILRLLPSSEKVKQLQSHVDVVCRLLRTKCVANPVNALIDGLTSKELHQIFSTDAYRESIDVDLLTLSNISCVMNSLTADQRYEFVSKQDKEGDTSLHLVTTDKALQILQSLSPTQRNQLLGMTNNEGKTAIDVKEEEGDLDVVELLQYRSSVSIQQTPGSSGHEPTDMTGSVELDSILENPSVDATQMSASLHQTNQLISTVREPPISHQSSKASNYLDMQDTSQPQLDSPQMDIAWIQQQIFLPSSGEISASVIPSNDFLSLSTDTSQQPSATQRNDPNPSSQTSLLQVSTQPAQVYTDMLPVRGPNSATPSGLLPHYLLPSTSTFPPGIIRPHPPQNTFPTRLYPSSVSSFESQMKEQDLKKVTSDSHSTPSNSSVVAVSKSPCLPSTNQTTSAQTSSHIIGHGTPSQSNTQPPASMNMTHSTPIATNEDEFHQPSPNTFTPGITRPNPPQTFHPAHLNSSSTSSSQTLPPPTAMPQSTISSSPSTSATNPSTDHLIPAVVESHDQEGEMHTGSKRPAPSDWSGHPSTTSDLNVLSEHIENQTVQFTFRGKKYRASFKPSDRVSDLINQVEKVTRGKCSIKDQAGCELCDLITLDLVKPPFVMCVDNSKAIISESAEPSTSTSSQPPAVQKTKVFGRVGNVQEVVDLLTFVHEQIKEGKTVNGALKLAKKNRKTIDRFLNIYYLHSQNSERLLELERDWLSKGQPGGLQGLDEMAKKEINWDQLKIMFYKGSVADFTLKKDKESNG